MGAIVNTTVVDRLLFDPEIGVKLLLFLVIVVCLTETSITVYHILVVIILEISESRIFLEVLYLGMKTILKPYYLM